MTFESLGGFVWLVACLVPFLLAQRWLHQEIQSVFLLITRSQPISLGLFSLLFFPGVFLHEASHFIMAKMLRVHTGDFSLLPTILPDGRLRLGYVETGGADVVREALIGTAPLITGGAVIAFIGLNRMGLEPLVGFLTNAKWDSLLSGLAPLPQLTDFWVWFYLAFTVSSTMLPSESDRHAWLPVIIGAVALIGIAVLAGAGSWMLSNLLPAVNQGMGALAIIFGISLLLHLFLLLPVFLIRKLLNLITGLEVA